MTTTDSLTGWRRLIYGSRAPRTALVAAAALSLPTCAVGIFMDDYFHQGLLEGLPGMPGSRWALFTFASGVPAETGKLIENGPYPWWTLPALQFSFQRPLSSALANLDTFLFGRAFFWHHLHSVLWYLALVAVVTAFLRRALGPASGVAALAAVLFALDDAHALVAGWLANRNALVATVPALLGVMAHVRWREDGWRWGLPLSLLGFTVGLAGGEPALSALAYLAAHELTAAPGARRARAIALAPVAALGLGYVTLYRLSGAGAFGSEIYVDPSREPLGYLLQAPPKALALAGAQFLGVSADLWLGLQSARPALVATGVCALLLITSLVRSAWPALEEEERRGLRWLALGAALSVLPVLATFPLNRLLLMPSIGGAALVAAVLRHGLHASRPRLARLGAGLLLFVNVVPSLGWLAATAILRLGADYQRRSSLETPLSDEALSRRVFVLVAPDPAAALYTPMVRTWHHRPPSRAWHALSFAPFAHRLTRVAADTIELEVVGGRMLETVLEQLMRASKFPLREGATVRLSGAELTVTGLDRGLPSRVRVRFEADPEGDGYTLATFDDERLVPFALPAVGVSVTLPRPKSLLSF